MTADGQECRLKNEPKSDRKKTKPARLKSPRAHRKNRPHNCGEKTKRRDDEKLSIHQKQNSKITTSAWQSGVCLRVRKKIHKTVSLMNTKRLMLAIVVAFVVLWITDFLIHGVWMTRDYQATQQLWRTHTEMQSHMVWMFGAQLLFVITFVTLWAKGFASATTKVSCAVGYGLLMGLFSGVWAIIMYVVVPMPGSIAAKWFCAGIAQTILLGLVTSFFTIQTLPQSNSD
jgi:hypothetical protein